MQRENYLDMTDEELINASKKASRDSRNDEISSLLFALTIRLAVLSATLNCKQKEGN